MAREYTIVSPEKVELDYSLAGLGSRIAAGLLDSLIWVLSFIILYFISLAVIAFLESRNITINDLLANILVTLWFVGFIASFFLYPILFEIYKNGQTPGKKLLNIRVIMDNGAPVTVEATLKRNLMRVIDILPASYAVGLISMFFNPMGKRLGDMVAGTILVQERRHQLPDLETNSDVFGRVEYVEHPLAAYISAPQSCTKEDYMAIHRFIERRLQLPPEVQYKLSWQILQPLIPRLQIQIPQNIPPYQILEAIAAEFEKRNGLL